MCPSCPVGGCIVGVFSRFPPAPAMDAWKDSISKYIPTWSGASGASAGQADSGAPIEPTLSDDEAELSYPNTDEEDFGEEDSGEYEDASEEELEDAADEPLQEAAAPQPQPSAWGGGRSQSPITFRDILTGRKAPPKSPNDVAREIAKHEAAAAAEGAEDDSDGGSEGWETDPDDGVAQVAGGAQADAQANPPAKSSFPKLPARGGPALPPRAKPAAEVSPPKPSPPTPASSGASSSSPGAPKGLTLLPSRGASKSEPPKPAASSAAASSAPPPKAEEAPPPKPAEEAAEPPQEAAAQPSPAAQQASGANGAVPAASSNGVPSRPGPGPGPGAGEPGAVRPAVTEMLQQMQRQMQQEAPSLDDLSEEKQKLREAVMRHRIKLLRIAQRLGSKDHQVSFPFSFPPSFSLNLLPPSLFLSPLSSLSL